MFQRLAKGLHVTRMTAFVTLLPAKDRKKCKKREKPAKKERPPEEKRIKTRNERGKHATLPFFYITFARKSIIQHNKLKKQR